MATTASLDLTVWRNDDVFEWPLRVVGFDLTGFDLAMQIRLYGDAPGAALIDLAKVTEAGAQGLRVASVTVENGVPVSHVRVNIGKAARQALPYMGAAGEAAQLGYALLLGGVTRLVGSVIVPAHVYGSDNAPRSRPAGDGRGGAVGLPSAGATLTIAADHVVELVIDGAGVLQSVVNVATEAAEAAAAARDAAIAQTDALSADATMSVGRPAGVALVDGDPDQAAQAYFLDRVGRAGKLTSIDVFARGAGTFEIGFFRGAGNQVTRAAYTTIQSPGGNVARRIVLAEPLAVLAGDVACVRGAAAALYSYTSQAAADGAGYFLGPQAPIPEAATLGAATTNLTLQIRLNFTYREQVVTTASVGALADQLDKLYADKTAYIRRPATAPIVAADPAQGGQCFFRDPVVEAGDFASLDVYDRAVGTIEAAAFRKIAGTWTRIGLSSITTRGGNVLRTLPVAAPIAVEAGDIVCIRATADGLFSVQAGAAVDGAGYYFGPIAPIPPTAEIGAPVTNVLIHARVHIVSREQAVTADSFAALREDLADAPRGGSARVPLVANVRLPLLSTTAWVALILYGQSNTTAYEAKPALSTAQPYSNRTFGGGLHTGRAGNGYGAIVTGVGMSTSKPLVEQDTSEAAPGADGSTMNGETVCTAAASTFVELAAAKLGIDPRSTVVFASSAGHAGYSIAQLSKGSPWYQSVIDGIASGAALAHAAGKEYVPPVLYWNQGGDDARVGNSTAYYRAALLKLVADVNADGLAAVAAAMPGRAAPTSPIHFVLAQIASPYFESTRANLNLIQQAQFEAVNASPLVHYIAAEFSFAPVAAGQHLTNVSHRRMGAYVGRAMSDLIVDRCVPDCVWPVSAVASGTTLRLRFRVPTLPLVFDEVTFGALTDKGFVVQDVTGVVPIAAVTIAKSGDVVEIQLGRALGTDPVVRSGMDYIGATNRHLKSSSTCIRDSTDATAHGQPLWHVAPAFELPVQVLAGGGLSAQVVVAPVTTDIVATADQVADSGGKVMMTAVERAAVATITGGPLPPGAWVRLPAIYRLDVSGAGDVTIDVRTIGGVVRPAVFHSTAAGAAVQYPFFGGDAREVRATLTGTAQAEIV